MKNKITAFSAIAVSLILTAGFTACEGEVHKHTFSQEWTTDETYHWHAATCEHADEVKDKYEHVFENGSCVCGKKNEVTVTFDSNGGSAVADKKVISGEAVAKPANPTREGYCFEGWYNGESKYNFTSAVTGALTLKAKWTSLEDADGALEAALAADYSNFTSESTYTEGSDYYTDTFMQTEDTSYWKPGTALYEDHLVIFDDDGKMLAMYYLHEDEWKKSGLGTYADFVVALYLDEIDADWLEYVGDGVYEVDEDYIGSVVYALFRSNDTYSNLYFIIDNGHIVEVGGMIGDVIHVQTFYDFGETEIDIPDTLPAATVDITVKNKEIEVGSAVDKDELIQFLFTVKVEGKDYAVTPDMIDLDGLDCDDPKEGTYTVTVSFDTWDGNTHTETATVTVAVPQHDETFAEIFAKDYSNVTISGGFSGMLVDGVYSMTNAYFYIEDDGSLTKYHATSFAETKNAWQSNLPRLDMLFKLDSSLFGQVEGSEDEYIVKNNAAIETIIKNTLLMKTYILDTTADYSITLKVVLGRVSEITIQCKYKSSNTASTSTAFTKTYTLSGFGETEFDIPAEIQAKRPA